MIMMCLDVTIDMILEKLRAGPDMLMNISMIMTLVDIMIDLRTKQDLLMNALIMITLPAIMIHIKTVQDMRMNVYIIMAHPTTMKDLRVALEMLLMIHMRLNINLMVTMIYNIQGVKLLCRRKNIELLKLTYGIKLDRKTFWNGDNNFLLYEFSL